MSDFRDEFQIQASASKLEKTRSAWFRWHVDAPQLSEGHGMFPEGSSESLRHVPPAGFAVSMGQYFLLVLGVGAGEPQTASLGSAKVPCTDLSHPPASLVSVLHLYTLALALTLTLTLTGTRSFPSPSPAPSRSVSLSLTHAMPPIRSGSVASINSVGDV